MVRLSFYALTGNPSRIGGGVSLDGEPKFGSVMAGISKISAQISQICLHVSKIVVYLQKLTDTYSIKDMKIELDTKFNVGDRVGFIRTELKSENGNVQRKNSTMYGKVLDIDVLVNTDTWVTYRIGVPCCGGFIPYNVKETEIISKEIPELAAYSDDELMKEIERRKK